MNSAIEYVTVPFMGCDVLAVALDGIPVKNHLPAPLAEPMARPWLLPETRCKEIQSASELYGEANVHILLQGRCNG
mgnify:CR=1 FL=1